MRGEASRRGFLATVLASVAGAACGGRVATPTSSEDAGAATATATDAATSVEGGAMTSAAEAGVADVESEAAIEDATTDVGCVSSALALGAASSFALGTWRQVPNGSRPVTVGHDDLGFFAMIAVCPIGCALDPPDARGIQICACHGQQYDGDGRPYLNAISPLTNIAVVECEGTLSTDLKKPVPIGTRTPAA
jgi:Rieske Fe-S protein